MKNEWFASWFDSKYYHMLYKNRNDAEAKLFITNMVQHLQLQAKDAVIDIACGKGRHSIMLASHGLQVLGVDLSKNSIEFAQQFSDHNLEFAVHDMRQALSSNYYQAAFNLFTSFGYFNTTHDNMLAAEAISTCIKPNGYLVIDFLNVATALQNVAANKHESKVIDGVRFEIEREFTNNKICKHIQVFENDALVQQHTEQVNALQLADFEHYFGANNMVLQNTFGNYNLDSFSNESPRLIMVFKKIIN